MSGPRAGDAGTAYAAGIKKGIKPVGDNSWILWTITAVLVLLTLWQVARQWKVKSKEAEAVRVAEAILLILVAAVVAWHFMR